MAIKKKNLNTRKPHQAGAFSAWKAREARATGAAVEILHMLPTRRYAAEENPHVVGYDGLGFPTLLASSPMDERLIELLCFLSRTYIADADILYRLFYYRRYSLSTLYKDLARLRERRYIWNTKITSLHNSVSNNGRPGRGHMVMGLSRAGKQLLMDLAVEADVRAVDLMIARDVRGRPPKPSSLSHDLQVSGWCASMVEGLRLIPWCTSIYLRTEFTEIKGQRADAMLVARFDFRQPRPELEMIPWFDGTPIKPGEIELRWALELDNSTESVPILIEKFVTYRDLHAEGTYHTMFKGAYNWAVDDHHLQSKIYNPPEVPC